MSYLLLLAPAANHVYAQETPRLAAAELAVTAGVEVAPVSIAGVDYLRLGEADVAIVAAQSARLALFQEEDGLLRPVKLPTVELLDSDLVTIPKYPGKTNERFTRLLLNVTLSQVQTRSPRRTVLDPLCGRGTTLTTAWRLGLDAAGVESDPKAVEAFAAYLKTWLRRKRMKHTVSVCPVRRDGRNLGRRCDADVSTAAGRLRLGVFTGDTRESARLWGRRRFDAIVTDAPYGVVHGSHSDVRGLAGKDRSAARLLTEAIPVWSGQLKPYGALGLSWNTHAMAREQLLAVLTEAGLIPLDDGPWRRFGHRVDSSIHRDLVVAVKPGT